MNKPQYGPLVVEKIQVRCATLSQTDAHFLENAAVAVKPEWMVLIQRRSGTGEEEYKKKCGYKKYSVYDPRWNYIFFHLLRLDSLCDNILSNHCAKVIDLSIIQRVDLRWREK